MASSCASRPYSVTWSRSGPASKVSARCASARSRGNGPSTDSLSNQRMRNSHHRFRCLVHGGIVADKRVRTHRTDRVSAAARVRPIPDRAHSRSACRWRAVP